MRPQHVLRPFASVMLLDCGRERGKLKRVTCTYLSLTCGRPRLEPIDQRPRRRHCKYNDQPNNQIVLVATLVEESRMYRVLRNILTSRDATLVRGSLYRTRQILYTDRRPPRRHARACPPDDTRHFDFEFLRLLLFVNEL
jgi:hypothetical protein